MRVANEKLETAYGKASGYQPRAKVPRYLHTDDGLLSLAAEGCWRTTLRHTPQSRTHLLKGMLLGWLARYWPV